MTTYEQLLALIATIPNGIEGRDRSIQWLTSAEVVGAARDHLGHVELFLAGPALRPRTKTLRSAIQHHSWHCLLYTSDAADERSSVDLGGRRIIKKKKYRKLSDAAADHE